MAIHPSKAERFLSDLQDLIEEVSSFWIPTDELWRVLDRMADEGHREIPTSGDY